MDLVNEYEIGGVKFKVFEQQGEMLAVQVTGKRAK
jgi:hypothetical protein